MITRFIYSQLRRTAVGALTAVLLSSPRFAHGQDTPVDIPDAELRAAIEEALGKQSGAEIAQDEMASLTSLTATDRSVENLTGLEFATNLETLDLRYNQIADSHHCRDWCH